MTLNTQHGPVAIRTRSFSANPRHMDRGQPIKCIGNWQLMELAGRGTCADVYAAKPLGCRPNWHADYVVKVLKPEYMEDALAIQSMTREAVVGSRVSQPHLVPILESHVHEAPYYVVMPKLEGATVSQVIQRIGAIEPRQALWITRQVAEALEALHAQDWLHGDVKPANIVVSVEGHATLIDLGFALQRHEAVLTAERMARGTLSYIAPEVMTSAHSADQRSDIYSLGISLFEMLTASRPFESNNAADLIDMHRGRALPDIRRFGLDLPHAAAVLLQKMTSKQPLRRPQTARDLIEELIPLEVEFMKMVGVYSNPTDGSGVRPYQRPELHPQF